MDRADGYTYMSYAVQGVRAYDSTSQQWMTPDAFPGDVADPLSQKPFMWNDGNPVQWADPTGFIVVYANQEAEDALKRIIATMEKDSPQFAHMMEELRNSPNVFTISLESSDEAASAGEGGHFSGNLVETLTGQVTGVNGGTVAIAQGLSSGDMIDSIAHEITHAFDSLDTQQYISNTFGPKSHVFTDTNDPNATREEVNGYAGAHSVLSQMGKAADWVGPATWMSSGESPTWNEFCGQFKMYGAC